jgi:hypothetical protein
MALLSGLHRATAGRPSLQAIRPIGQALRMGNRAMV